MERGKSKEKVKSTRKNLLHAQPGKSSGRTMSPIRNGHSTLDGQINGRKGHHPAIHVNNATSLPPPIVLGSRKRLRNNIEFVYPRDYCNGGEPYVFDTQRKAKESYRTGETAPLEKAHSPQDQLEHAKKPKVTSESIDDILFRESVRKHPQAMRHQEQHQVEGASTAFESTQEKDNVPSISVKDQKREKTAPLNIETAHSEDKEGGRLSGLSVEDAVRDKVGCRPRSNSTDGELNLPRRGLCDERIVLEAHRWKNPMGRTAPKGFMNLGNTCFLNATLQCLAYLPTFSQTLTSFPLNNGIKMSKGQRITTTLCSLFRQVHGLDDMRSDRDALAPGGIVQALPSLGNGGQRSGYKFRPGRQEDAHEFLVHLLDAMHDGELKAAGINQHASGWRDRLPIPRLDETTFIHRLFGGYLRSQVKCTKCDYRSNTYDPFLDLSLEVSKKNLSSVASAFSEFTRKEILDSANRWKCSGCKKHVCASKQLTVFRPPLTLCIQLKRFTYDGGFANLGGGGWGFGHYGGKGMGLMGRGGSKISKSIDFPEELNLPLSDGRKCEYQLTGIVVHIGGSASSGHYTAFVKKPDSLSRNNLWYHMDDSFVEPVSEKKVLRQKDAYLLFYCRKEVKIEYPSPPPRSSMSAEEAREHGSARARARATTLDRGRLELSSQTLTSPARALNESAPGRAGKKPLAQTTSSPASSSKSDESETSTPKPPETTITSNKTVSQPPSEPAAKNEIQTSESYSSSSSSSSSSSLSEDSDSEGFALRENTDLASKRSPHDTTHDDTSSLPKAASATSSDSDERSSSPSDSDDTSDSDNGKSSSDSTTSDSSDITHSEKIDEKEKPINPLKKDNAVEKQSQSTVSDSVIASSRNDGIISTSVRTSSDSSESSDDDETDREEEAKTQALTHDGRAKLSTPDANRGGEYPTVDRKTRVVLGLGGMRGKLEVMLGPRHGTKAWKPRSTVAISQDAKNELLGAIRVGKWDDDDEDGTDFKTSNTAQSDQRKNALRQLEKRDRSRKRKMHLDGWDAMLDQGKKKKLKSNQDFIPHGNITPKKNPFHRIQSGMQRMNQGKAKGWHRSNAGSSTPRNSKNRRSSF